MNLDVKFTDSDIVLQVISHISDVCITLYDIGWQVVKWCNSYGSDQSGVVQGYRDGVIRRLESSDGYVRSRAVGKIRSLDVCR